MKVGFDVSQTGAARAGCGYFADSLIRALAERASHMQFVLYPTFGSSFFDKDWQRSTFVSQRPNFARGLGHAVFDDLLAFWASVPADFERQLGSPDVIHSNNFFCPKRLRHARLVYTLYDLSFLQEPDWSTEANRQSCFEGVFQASLQADHIIAISQFSKQHFLETFPHYPEERISVVHLASRFTNSGLVSRPAKMAGLEPDRFWLCVGTLEPRKNHANLLHAYAKLKERSGKMWPLVLAGGKGWLLENLDRLIADLGLGGDVIMTGYVDDATLQWLYQNCHAALYPSLFEGFGLPVLEAMSLGAAVITSNTTSIPEITGDAALLVDPCRDDEICEAMRKLIEEPNLRLQLRGRAEKQASRFRWQSAADAVVQCYEQTISSPPLREVLGRNRSSATVPTDGVQYPALAS